jgi:hypothetical protein
MDYDFRNRRMLRPYCLCVADQHPARALGLGRPGIPRAKLSGGDKKFSFRICKRVWSPLYRLENMGRA